MAEGGPGSSGRRTLAAFAEALIPGTARLPPARGHDGVEVVTPVARLLASMPPRTRQVVALALRLFELTSVPRRFSRLAPDRRARHIARLEESRLSPLRDLTFLLKGLTCFAYGRDPAVQDAVVGRDARCAVSPAPPEPRWERKAPPLDPAALGAPTDIERCDVVVVGSGAGGASAARVLAERGLDVIVVEQGAYHDAASFSTDPIDAMPMLYRDGGLTFCEGRPGIPLPVGRCVGGTTVVNSGTCLRPPEEVLMRWRDVHGIPWAASLEMELEAVKRALHVAPVDPATAGRNAELCRTGADAIGASNGPIPRNAGHVTCCGACPTGCAIDAKQAMHVSELPRAAAAGARIRAGAAVERILVEQGRACGVVARVDGGRYEVRSRAVVLAGGALGTPELLLRQGVANRSGHVGRHLRIHPACWVGALFEQEVRGWEGVMQSWLVDEWQDRGLFLEATFTPLPFGAHWLRGAGDRFMEQLECFDRLAVIGVHLSERSEGRLRIRGGRLRIRYRLRSDDAAAIRFGIARAADIHFAAGAREAYPQLGRVPAVRPGQQGELVERARVRPGQLRLEGFHPMGTARMGADPDASVVAPSGECHDLAGLWVTDASLFPTAVKVNPMVTIMACARRVAAALAERL